jgi:hypothetical protein
MVLSMTGASYDDGEYVAACVLKPENFQAIDGIVVDFDASNTKGIRVTDGVIDELFPGEDNFIWTWRFFNPMGVEFVSSPYVSENNNDFMAYIFSRVFPAAGNNLASLFVEVGDP